VDSNPRDPCIVQNQNKTEFSQESVVKRIKDVFNHQFDKHVQACIMKTPEYMG
jgi:hypothetical protein